MKAEIWLCDYASVNEGKLNIIGGGWTIRALVQPVPFSLAIRMITAWNEANVKHAFKLRLLTQDGQVVLGPLESMMFEATGEFEVGRPPGFVQGEDLISSLTVHLPPLTFKSGMYVFQVEVGTEVIGKAPFRIVRG